MRYCPEGEDIYRIAYGDRNASHHRQSGASLTIDRQAGYLTDGIADADCQQQIEVDEGEEIRNESPDQSDNDGHTQRRADGPEIVGGGDTESGEFVESGAITAAGADRRLNQAFRANQFTAFTAPQIRFNVRMSGAP